MPLQHLDPFDTFRDQHFTIGGSPSNIAASAQPWREVQQLLVHGAGELSAVVPEGFEGNVGLAYRQNIGEALPAEMKAAADIAERIAQVYTQYADDVAGANVAMDATKLIAEAIHQEVNVAIDCVNRAEANMSIANSMGQPILVATAKSALDASMAFYEAAKWSWDQQLQQAQAHKNDLRSQVQAHESTLAGVVGNSRLGAVELVKPPRELSFLRVILSELIEVAGTVGKIVNRLVPAARSIHSLTGVDVVVGESMTAADRNVQRHWSSAFDELIQLIHRAERQAAKFIVLYREADQMNEKDLAEVEPLIEGLFQSVLADDKHTKVLVDAAMSLEERITHLGTDSLLWDPYLGEELNPQVIAGDIRRMNSSISGPFSMNDEAVERNQVRGRNLDDLARILTQTSAVEGPLTPGTTSRIISLPSVTAVGADDYAQRILRTPSGNYFEFNDKGLPQVPKGRFKCPQYEAKVAPDGSLMVKMGDKGYERVYPRVPRGASLSPSVVFESFDAKTGRQVQHFAYPNGMVVEVSTRGSGSVSNGDAAVQRPTISHDKHTPLSYAWRSGPHDQVTAYSPEKGLQNYYVPKSALGIVFNEINKVMSTISPYSAVVDGAMNGIDRVNSSYQEMATNFDKYSDELSKSQVFEDLHRYTKPLGKVVKVFDATSLILGYVETVHTGSAVPASKAAGGFIGGSLGGLGGAAIGGPLAPFTGGAGAYFGSQAGEYLGERIGKEMDRKNGTG